MNKTPNPCPRCGKQRVVVNTFTSKTESGSVLTHTFTVCPDQECQKLVEKGLLKDKEKRMFQKKESDRRERERIHNKKARSGRK